jgi:chromatin segregation and condensation protein Rec8/ScpA/Scc1 (kleisin family)
MDDRNSRLFPLGQIVASPTALAVTTDEERRTFLHRHQIGSWEETNQEDRLENILGLFQNLRIFTVHNSAKGKVWIITEADRSITTILTPEDY